MRKQFGPLSLAIIGLLVVPTIAWSQDHPPVIQDGTPVVMEQKTAPRTASGKPDLSGLWSTPSTDENKILAARYGAPKNARPELTPWAQERFEYNTDSRHVLGYSGTAAAGTDSGKFLTSEGGGIYGGRTELNPIYKCFPPGAAYLIAGWQSSASHEIIQSDKRVLMIYEYDHTVRQIWTDGRKHPDQVDPSWMGHSVASWDGDTLVVDTVGLRNGEREVWLDDAGHVASNGLHIVERYTRLDNYTLQIDFTLDDPKAFKTPWVRREYRRLRPQWDLVEWQTRCYPGAPEMKAWEEDFNQIFTEP